MSGIKRYAYYFGSILTLFRGVRRPFRLIPLFLKSKQSQPQLLELRHSGQKMWVRGRMDAWSVKESMLDRFYERFGTKVQSDWTVVDVGAAIGEFTVLAAKEAKQGQVFAIEPNPESIALLKRNLQANDIANVILIQKGLWRENGQQTLNLINQEPLQAMTLGLEAADSKQIGFETQTLEDFIKEFQIVQIDLLKSDCEGAEYDFLLISSPNVLQIIKRIVMEYHDLDENRHHQKLKEFLIANGYQVSLVPNWVHPHIGYLFAKRTSSD